MTGGDRHCQNICSDDSQNTSTIVKLKKADPTDVSVFKYYKGMPSRSKPSNRQSQLQLGYAHKALMQNLEVYRYTLKWMLLECYSHPPALCIGAKSSL